MAKFQREKYCCSEITTPIRVYKLVTIYESQVVSIGIRKYWDNAVVTLPTKHIKTQPVMELVAFSRAT